MEAKCIVTEIVGTFREDLYVGGILIKQPFDSYGKSSNLTFKVLRESDEEEYRKKYNYIGPLPKDEKNRTPKFYEIVALD